LHSAEEIEKDHEKAVLLKPQVENDFKVQNEK